MIDLRAELEVLEQMREDLYRIFPSYITHIRFPRYKNIADEVRLDFTFPVTALVGPNGSGKTSVLNALYGAPMRHSTGEYWFSTEVDPIIEGEGSPNRFIYGHYNRQFRDVVETRKARVRKERNGRVDPNYWEPTKEAPGDQMVVPQLRREIQGRSKDRWNPVVRKVIYINFRRELSAFDKYFYFGKDPVPRKTAGVAGPRRILSKKDLIRKDAGYLATVLDLGDTSLVRYGRKVATENRLLKRSELEAASFILGRKYERARLVRHRLFQGNGGLSVRFKTSYGQYSEAFAGSGEVAVASCVVQVLSAKRGSLILLDEPEVSLHPGAQERLLAFLVRTAKQLHLQVVFSTHSPHLIASLPDDAIKTFVQLKDGSFSVLPSTHPYAAFRRLGFTDERRLSILVEDRLAQAVVEQAIRLIQDEELRGLFSVAYPPGGASAILTYRIPVLMESPSSVLVLLDGDQRRDELRDPNQIPEGEDAVLGEIIRGIVGADPQLFVDGGAHGGNAAQRIRAQRSYLRWAFDNLRFLPRSCPEEIILRASGILTGDVSPPSGECKQLLHDRASENLGRPASSDETDAFGAFLLGANRQNSPELNLLAQLLQAFAEERVRPGH